VIISKWDATPINHPNIPPPPTKSHRGEIKAVSGQIRTYVLRHDNVILSQAENWGLTGNGKCDRLVSRNYSQVLT
jgi:hypothetical protein